MDLAQRQPKMIRQFVPSLPELALTKTEVRMTAQGREVWAQDPLDQSWHLAGVATSEEHANLFAASFDLAATGERVLPVLRYFQKYETRTPVTDAFAAALARARGKATSDRSPAPQLQAEASEA